MSGLLNYMRRVFSERVLSGKGAAVRRAENFEQHVVVSHYLDGIMDKYDPDVPRSVDRRSGPRQT